MNKIELTIIIAAFNSEKLLPLVLDAIKKQTFPKDKMEVIIVDGGSKDKTFEIAERYGCRVINNPRTEPVYGKFLGYTKAQGHYVIYIDTDEVMENKDSLLYKYEVFQKNKDIHAVIGSGYKNPKGYPIINNYINEFGDPFSAFMYDLSKDARFFLKEMKNRYQLVEEKQHHAIFSLAGIKDMPLIELCAGGSMFDARFMKKEFPETTKKPELIPHFFYLLQSKSPLIAITKNDVLIHYSADTLSKYANKIRWRVKNNIYHVSDMGESGFSGREKYSRKFFQNKKYLFPLYVYTIVFCLFDSIRLSLTRKNIYYLIHFPLCIFTANLIMYHFIRKLLGYHPQLESYCGKQLVKNL